MIGLRTIMFWGHTDGHGFAMRMMCFYSPTDGTDEHGFGIFKVALTKTTKIQLGDIHEKH